MGQARTISAKRETIVAAARACFIRFGYQKTSFADVANVAGISRASIYSHFKSKDEMLGAVFTAIFEERYPAVERILASRGTTSSKLVSICDQLFVEPWAEVMGGAASADFRSVCERIIPEAASAYEKRRLRYVRALVGDREVAEVFSMAADGLLVDLPSAAVLRKRLRRLIERFV